MGSLHLELRSVSKSFGHVKAVDGLSLVVPRGAVFGLLGPNGAGKTTTIRVVMRITLPDAGTITLAGVPIDDAVRERIGYLPEEHGGEHLRDGAVRRRGLPRRDPDVRQAAEPRRGPAPGALLMRATVDDWRQCTVGVGVYSPSGLVIRYSPAVGPFV